MFDRILELLKVLVLPSALALIGHSYTSALTEREIEGRFVELAVSILSEEPTPDSQSLRRWAVSIINRHSGVHMGDDVKDSVIQSQTLPTPTAPSAVSPWSLAPAPPEQNLRHGTQARKEAADGFQTAAYEALLVGDVDRAIESLRAADGVYPRYGTSWEVMGLLQRRRDALIGDQAELAAVIGEIVEHFSWHIPADVLRSLREAAAPPVATE